MRKITVRCENTTLAGVSQLGIAVLGEHLGKPIECYCKSVEDAHVFAKSIDNFQIFDVKTHKRLL